VRDPHSLPYFVRGRDVIFNLAGQTSHVGSMEDPFTDLEINARSQLSVLEACRRHNPDVKIVFASTRQIYGRPQYLPVEERHPRRCARRESARTRGTARRRQRRRVVPVRPVPRRPQRRSTSATTSRTSPASRKRSAGSRGCRWRMESSVRSSTTGRADSATGTTSDVFGAVAEIVTRPFLDLSREVEGMRTEFERAVNRVLDEGRFVSGRFVKEFERLCFLLRAEHAVGVASGTDAIKIGLAAVRVGAGGEVITATNTCVPTIAGLRPPVPDRCWPISILRRTPSIPQRSNLRSPTGRARSFRFISTASARTWTPILELARSAGVAERGRSTQLRRVGANHFERSRLEQQARCLQAAIL
jgi:DegT/DnrJ/EryC1/StrS aminotransferase family/GDP-mannose 4,6 dehydratase